MSEVNLTKRQQQILDFIRSFTEKNGYPPSVREIGKELGLSSSATVHAHLAALETKGFIHKSGSKSRSLTLADKALADEDKSSPEHPSPRRLIEESDVVKLPLVGRVAAGEPILAEQNIESTFPLPKEIIGDTSSFLLKVRGESMIGAGIFDGDYVVVREQQNADNGDIVVALLDDGATVKTFYKERDCIRLQPQNEAMEPIYTDKAVIIGKVVALLRSM